MTTQTAIFAAGCFWGVEAYFFSLVGVLETRVGYTGGHTDNPTYREVCNKGTGHAEAVEVIFDPAVISYDTLLKHFWQMHNPTLKDRQGPDIGSQYRSAIFYTTDEQQQQAEQSKQQAQADFAQPIVTQISAASTFYPAEAYHQKYFQKNPNYACHVKLPKENV